MNLAELRDSICLQIIYELGQLKPWAEKNRIEHRIVLSEEAFSRVAEICLNLAILWKSETIDYFMFKQMLKAALFDNIGIAEEILLKKGPLTDDEIRIVKDHPRLAFDTAALCNLGLSTTFVGIHHERADGKGYPRQIEITEWIKQVFIFVIQFTALTSPRPWRPNLSLAETCQILKDDQGLVDPEIAKGIMGVFKQEYRVHIN